jgi:pectinesterase
VFYAQYKCTGPGSNTARRVYWSHELSDAEAAPFLRLSFIDAGNWLRET